MATNSAVDADAASRISTSSSRRIAGSDARYRLDLAQHSAADGSPAMNHDAASSSVAMGAGQAPSASAEQVFSSSMEQQAAPPPPPFEPIFALLTNTTTSTTVHPRVHYIFSDDDVSIPTDPVHDADDGSGHRGLVVDLEPTPTNDAWAVSCASSLGAEFAVTAAELAKQQSEGDSGGGGGGGGGTGDEANNPYSGQGGPAGTLLLRVEGVSRDPVDLRSSQAIGSGSLPSSGSGSGANIESLADEFRRRMGVLKKVVGEGEKRRANAAQLQQQQLLHQEAADQYGEDQYQSNEIHDPGTLRSVAASQSQDVAGS